MARSPKQALVYAKNQSNRGSAQWYSLCLKFVRTCYGVGAKYPSAEKGWYGTRYRGSRTTNVPAGLPVWWTNGRYGHVAISAGGGYCWSNDVVSKGRIHKVKIADITRKWGQVYRGFSYDINGVLVATPPSKKKQKTKSKPVKSNNKGIGPKTKIDLSKVKSWRTNNEVKKLQNALIAQGYLAKGLNTGYYGTKTRSAVKRFKTEKGYKLSREGMRNMGYASMKQLGFPSSRIKK